MGMVGSDLVNPSTGFDTVDQQCYNDAIAAGYSPQDALGLCGILGPYVPAPGTSCTDTGCIACDPTTKVCCDASGKCTGGCDGKGNAICVPGLPVPLQKLPMLLLVGAVAFVAVFGLSEGIGARVAARA